MDKKSLTLSFDIGYASIGWAVLKTNNNSVLPEILGTGVVLFPKNSCLASSRRDFRRSRRSIAARRSRIERLKRYLEKSGVLTREELNQNSTSCPWFLVARSLIKHNEKLSWQELWCVLRWYAHNRGYDGNALWANDEIDAETHDDDTEKIEAAKNLMTKYQTQSMAETICHALGLDPLGDKRSTTKYFKNNNAAFPRKIVVDEVKELLKLHIGTLPKLDESMIKTICDEVPEETRKDVGLPQRFSNKGGLLFGQYLPRFDNRIIGKCRITGKNVPLKNCKEFLNYRWAQLLNNLTVFDELPTGKIIRKLTANERKLLDESMKNNGFFTKTSLNVAIKNKIGKDPANTESYFLTEEMEEALVLDPVKKCIASKKILKDIWSLFSKHGQKVFASRLHKGETLHLEKLIEEMRNWGDWENESALMQKICDLQKAEKPRGKSKIIKQIIDSRFEAPFPQGRAPYCREILQKVYDEALNGKDSTQEGGCLYETNEVRERLARLPLSKQTNNHMVRHRLLIFKRLLNDIVEEYAQGDKNAIQNVVVEVVRELKEFSGLDSKEIAQKLNEKNCNFKYVLKKIENELPGTPITASLLRLARILEDQGGSCPYTGKLISYQDLISGKLDKEHIIPRSLRPSDAISSVVLTLKEVNEMKGQKTSYAFMKENEGKAVRGTNIEIQPLKDYEKWVENHKNRKLGKDFSKQDQDRCKKRAGLMLIEHYDERNADFLERSLTQTSYLNKMAIRLVKQELNIEAKHLAGTITAFVRTKLNISDCLVQAVPRMQAFAQKNKLTKTEMRDLSHLHHAMDAITQGLTSFLFKVEDWGTLVKRNLNQREAAYLKRDYEGILKVYQNANGQFNLSMEKLPAKFKQAITKKLSENRVVQHVPTTMKGLRVDQTTWGILGNDKKGRIKLIQKTTDNKGNRYDTNNKRYRKTEAEKPSLLLGFNTPQNTKTSKLKNIKGVIKINGNWGCSLDPETAPTIIPFFKVFPQLRELKEKNNNKMPRIIRNGMLIKINDGNYKGIWQIASIKDNASGIALDIKTPDRIDLPNGVKDAKINVSLKSLLKSGLEILKPKLTGIACPTMS